MTRILRFSLSPAVAALLVSETVLLFGCYLLAAYWTQPLNLELYLFYDGGIQQIITVVVIIQLGLYYQLLYETLMPRSRLLLIQQLCMVLGYAFLLQALLGYGDWMLQLPKWTMIYGSLLALLVLPLWRMAYSALISRAIPVRRLLFLGGSAVVGDIASNLNRHPDLGLMVMGYLDEESENLPLVPWLGRVEDIDQVIRDQRPDRILTASSGSKERLPTRLLLDLQLSGMQIEEASALHETITGRISARDLLPSQMIFSSTFDPGPADLALKKFYSLLLGTAVTIAALPVFAAAALLIKASSSGPVLLRQKRIGLGGAPFDLYGFRSTRENDATATLTLAGRWLRRLRLRRLPQLFNVIRGDLSIVGPQAERPEFAAILETQIPFYRQRYCVQPGIIGWAEVNFKGYTDIQDSLTKLEYDLYYIKNLSPALDAYILLHSFSSI
jgi:lipopolysaccharide/colanic/teichoic acid biosynthesis glycosyltransferase